RQFGHRGKAERTQQPRRAARDSECRLGLTAVRRRNRADLAGGRFHAHILADFTTGARTNLSLSPWRARKNRHCLPMAQETQTESQAKAGAMIVRVTLFEQNCTILWHEPSKKAVVIDPGGDVPKIMEAIKQAGVTVEKIWLTHGHIDHVGGAAELRD